MGWQDTIQGAIGGGMVGGLGGALLGGYAAYKAGNPKEGVQNRLSELEKQWGQGQAPQLGQAAQGQYSDYRQNQQALVGRLEALSQGRGPSLAQAQLDAATDRNVRSQQAMAAGARGPNAAMAQYQAANNAAGLGAQASQDAVAARIAEQQMALQQLGLTIYGGREADEGMNRFNAGAQNQFSMANMQSQLQWEQMQRMSQLQALGLLQGGMGPSVGEQILAGGAGMTGMVVGQAGGMKG
jgi:hypothetical protein